MEPEIPKLPPRCQVCHHENRFKIQKAIDDGATSIEIEQRFGIAKANVQYHNNVGHRKDLLTWGYADYAIRKNAQIYDQILCEMAKKGLDAAKRMSPDDLKPTDIIKLTELGKRVSGEMVDKHEITVKKDLGAVIKDFLDVDEIKTS